MALTTKQTPRWVQRGLRVFAEFPFTFTYLESTQGKPYSNKICTVPMLTRVSSPKHGHAAPVFSRSTEKCQLQKHILFGEQAVFTRGGISNCHTCVRSPYSPL
jgi:hypothetical protein